jgi:putative serine protease PepD
LAESCPAEANDDLRLRVLSGNPYETFRQGCFDDPHGPSGKASGSLIFRPDKLWTGDWRSQSEEARRAAAGRNGHAAADPRPDPPAPAPVPVRKPFRARARGVRLAVAAGLGVLVIATGSFLAGTWTDGGSSATPAAEQPPLQPSAGQTRAGAVYASASPAVVSVRAGNATGTGFLLDRNDRIVTNYHVVEGADSVEVRFGSDGNSIEAKVRGTDPSSDLALLEIDSGEAPAGVKPLRLADSGDVRVGDLAIAIGNPFGLDRTATEGIVSGVGREIQAPNGFSIDSAIQTDAPINPGNSGGPLLDDAGRVIGVNSQIETGGAQGNVGVGFAVPSNTVRRVVPSLVRGEEIKRAYLGVETSPVAGSNQAGAEVQGIVSGGPADRAGLRRGDVITRVDGQDVAEPSDIAQAIADDEPGKEVAVEVRRDGSSVTLHTTLGTRPASTGP